MIPLRTRIGVTQKHSLLAILFLLLVVLLFFRDVLFGGNVLITANMSRWLPWRATATRAELERSTFRDDSAITYYPRRFLSNQEIEAGRIPLWNRYILCGTPHLADFQSAVYHPLNLILCHADHKWATGFFVIFHLTLGAVFLFLLLRGLCVGVAGALMGAVSFLFNAYFVTYLGHPVHISTGCWLPLLLLLISRKIKRGGGLVVPLVLALTILGGFPQTILYTFLIAGAYALFVWWGLPHTGKRTGAMRVAGLALLATLGIGMVLFQLLPTAEFGSLSERRAIALTTILDHHQPSLFSAIRMVLPDFFGNPVSETYWIQAVEGPLPHPSDLGFVGYGGLIPLVLAVAAVLFSRRREVLFFAGLAVLSLLLLFSPHIFALYYKILPFARFSSEIHRLQFPFLLAIALLSGFGLDAMSERARNGRWKGPKIYLLACLLAIPLLASALQWGGPPFLEYASGRLAEWTSGPDRDQLLVSPRAATFLSGQTEAWLRYEWTGMARFAVVLCLGGVSLLLLRRGGRVASVALCLLLLTAAADGWTFARLYYTPHSRKSIYQPHPALERLAGGGDLFRVGRLARQYLLPSNTGLPYGVEDVGGVNALMPADYGRLFREVDPSLFPDSRRIAPFRSPQILRLPLWDLLNMRYLLVGPTYDPEFVVQTANAGEEGEVRFRLLSRSPFALIENRRALPRAFLHHTYRVSSDRTGILHTVTSPRFDPRGPILLEEQPPFPPGEKALLPGDRCVITRHEGTRLHVRTRSDEPALLFLSENYYPGWEAIVDGEPTPIYRADYTFRAVPLPAGEHQVVFRYRGDLFWKGLKMSALSLLLYLCLVGHSWLSGEGSIGATIRTFVLSHAVARRQNRSLVEGGSADLR